jgi:hypothetical protein
MSTVFDEHRVRWATCRTRPCGWSSLTSQPGAAPLAAHPARRAGGARPATAALRAGSGTGVRAGEPPRGAGAAPRPFSLSGPTWAVYAALAFCTVNMVCVALFYGHDGTFYPRKGAEPDRGVVRAVRWRDTGPTNCVSVTTLRVL